MSSVIANQSESIQQLAVPVGVGIQANSSPSLLPIVNQVATDVAAPGKLFVGNGSTWLNAAAGSGLSSATDFQALAFTMTTSASNPNFTGNIYIQKFQTATQTLCYFEFYCGQTLSVALPDTWISPANTISAAFAPTTILSYNPVYVGSSTLTDGNGALLRINTNGSILLQLPVTDGSTSISIYSVSGIYKH